MNNFKTGKFLTELRKEKGLTQTNLAEMLNITHQAVSKWENGESLPDIQILIQLGTLYEVTVEEIVQGERAHSKIIINESSSPSERVIPIISLVINAIGFIFLFLNVFKFDLNDSILGFPGFFGMDDAYVNVTGYGMVFNGNGYGALVIKLMFFYLVLDTIISILVLTNTLKLDKKIVTTKIICIIAYVLLGLSNVLFFFSNIYLFNLLLIITVGLGHGYSLKYYPHITESISSIKGVLKRTNEIKE